MILSQFGWDETRARQFTAYRADGLTAARVTLEQKNLYTVVTAEVGEVPAMLAGRLYHVVENREDLPVVGDWVAVRLVGEQAVIHAVLHRTSKFSRQQAWRSTGEQLVAANIDTLFLVMGLDGDYNLRRLERYLVQAVAGGAQPVVLLTKADLCVETADRVDEVAGVAHGVAVHAVSAPTGVGIAALDRYLLPGRTLALLGSSGVGKSTLLNVLLGNATQRTQEVRETDSHGRHTTTHRQLFLLPSGAMIIDTPGMREMQLWADDDDLQEAFTDIESLAACCRFVDCRHEHEPGCCVRDALQSGTLDDRHYDHYQQLRRELQYLQLRLHQSAAQAERSKWKQVRKYQKEIKKRKP